MPITADDVYNVKFKRQFRGYDENEVDDFLDEVIAQMGEYEAKIQQYQDRLAVLDEQIERYETADEKMKQSVDALQASCEQVIAQANEQADDLARQAKETLEQAEKQAAQMVQEAKERADAHYAVAERDALLRLHQIHEQIERANQNLEIIRNKSDEFKQETRTLLEAKLRQMDVD